MKNWTRCSCNTKKHPLCLWFQMENFLRIAQQTINHEPWPTTSKTNYFKNEVKMPKARILPLALRSVKNSHTDRKELSPYIILQSIACHYMSKSEISEMIIWCEGRGPETKWLRVKKYGAAGITSCLRLPSSKLISGTSFISPLQFSFSLKSKRISIK